MQPSLSESPYRPSPEAPSPRWASAARAARVLGWVSLAVVPVRIVASVLHAWAYARIMSHDSEGALHGMYAANALSSLTLLIAWSAALYFFVRVLALPAWVKARTGAWLPIACEALSALTFVGSFLATRLHFMPPPDPRNYGRMALSFGLEWVLATASAVSIAVLLNSLADQLGGRRARWLYALVALGVLHRLLGPLLGFAQNMLLGRASIAGGVFAIGGALVQGVFAYGWSRAYAQAADTLAAQSAPERATA